MAKKRNVLKKLANSIIQIADNREECLFIDAESIVSKGISDFGYDAVKNLSIRELIEDLENMIPKTLIDSQKVIFTR